MATIYKQVHTARSVTGVGMVGKVGNVQFKRKELEYMLPQYVLIDDCLDGEARVKSKREKYLPKPNPADTSAENLARFNAYLARAVFYNVTQRTLAGLVGQVFLTEPVIELPKSMEIMRDDATGSGVSITQLAQTAIGEVLAKGRAGILADYPQTDGNVSKKELEEGDIRPTLTVYSANDIINWRTIARGGRKILSLVVLREDEVYEDDGFNMKTQDQFRVLRLVTIEALQSAANPDTPVADMSKLNVKVRYQVEIYVKREAGFILKAGYPIYPTDQSGAELDEIPFTFIGAQNNDDTIDHPPMYDLASLNIAHYRNSADYEESAFMVGQPTPILSGLTQDWVKTVLNGTVTLGSRAAIPLPVGGEATLLQAEANTMPFEAMDHKERQMVSLGAKLVEQKQVQRTATEADIENTAETSVLATCANNVGKAFEWVLEWATKFVGSAESTIKFELNKEYNIANMTAADRAELIKEWQSNAITWEEMRDGLRKAGVATVDDEKAKNQIENDAETNVGLHDNPANLNNPGNPQNVNNPNNPKSTLNPKNQPKPKK